MIYKLYNKIFLSESLRSKELKISVVGTSMFPTLLEGDIITISKCKEYEIGNILVFLYKDDEIIVHRLLKIENGTYFCKGDNCFRLEDVPYERIVGKVIKINNEAIQPCPKELTEHSLKVHKKLAELNYDIEKLKTTEIYKNYEKLYLRRQ